MQFKCEAHVAINNSGHTAESAVRVLLHQSCSIHCKQGQYNLIFNSTSASIRILERGLLLRVEADDCLLCHGTKTLLEGEIGRHAHTMPAQILWIEGDEIPFKAITNVVFGGRSRRIEGSA